MSEKEKMLRGELYDPTDKELADRRALAHRLSTDYNATYETEEEKRKAILDKLMPNRGEGSFLQGPIQMDYGCFITVGKHFYANFNLVVLDVCPINIGDDVYCGPNVTFAAPLHPIDPNERRMRFKPDGSPYDLEYGKPITVGNDCWLASNVTVCGGVTIGDGCVIGAGSVVTRDIPPYSLAAGNPCRVIRKIEVKKK